MVTPLHEILLTLGKFLEKNNICNISGFHIKEKLIEREPHYEALNNKQIHRARNFEFNGETKVH